MYHELEDSQLIKLIRAGNHDAFAELVTRHTDKYFKLAYQTLQNTSDAEDVVQNAFIKFWQNPSAWDGQRSRFTTWFYRVVLNACNDIHRKNKHRAVPRQLNEPMSMVGEILPNEQMNTNSSMHTFTQSEEYLLDERQQATQQQKCLELAISQLPCSQRDALNLVVYSELPQKQAAMVMGVSLKALESLLVRARRTLVQTAEKNMQSMSGLQYGMNTNQTLWGRRQ